MGHRHILNNVFMIKKDGKLVRIGVYYDGNYFLHVSNYYNFSHDRRSRISISGLHDFIRQYVAREEDTTPRLTQVVDAHYFRGRLPAQEAKNRNKLLSERLFEDILMKEGVITHHLPLTNRGENSIDVWLALDAYEAAMLKQYDVLVLIACDSDFVPLVRKLNAMGTRVMVLGWEFEYTDEFGNKRVTVTSAQLLDEVSYPVRMHQIINQEDDNGMTQAHIDALFVPREPNAPASEDAADGSSDSSGRNANQAVLISDERHTGRIQNVKEGYGFIENEASSRNLFFYWEDVDGDFNELRPGMWVEYSLGHNHRGECAVDVVPLDESEAPVDIPNVSSTSDYDD